MKLEKEFDRMFRQEFSDLAAKMIWQNDDGDFEVFDHYIIVPENKSFRVFCSASDIGLFMTTRSALSWCIADKCKQYNLAREIQETDRKLEHITNDISVRAGAGDRSKQPQFRETILTKLESKIIKKKQLETQLNKCVNFAKYTQQKEYNNETVRTGRTPQINAKR
jgi:hypothetical protein